MSDPKFSEEESRLIASQIQNMTVERKLGMALRKIMWGFDEVCAFVDQELKERNPKSYLEALEYRKYLIQQSIIVCKQSYMVEDGDTLLERAAKKEFDKLINKLELELQSIGHSIDLELKKKTTPAGVKADVAGDGPKPKEIGPIQWLGNEPEIQSLFLALYQEHFIRKDQFDNRASMIEKHFVNKEGKPFKAEQLRVSDSKKSKKRSGYDLKMKEIVKKCKANGS